MKTETKSKIKNFTLEILDFFLGIPESVLYSFDRKEFYRIMQGMPTEKILAHTKITGLISDLKKRNYISIIQKDNQRSIEFTNKAKVAIIDKVFDRSLIDDKLRLISFDIPESKRINRNQFRRSIKRLGFRQIQKSLWANNRNVGDYIDILVKEYKVEKYIVYIVAEKTNIEDVIKDMFKD
jgi:CRISPR-associated endonuclease Cas2